MSTPPLRHWYVKGAVPVTATLNVTVPPTVPPSWIEMSDLQLASVFQSYEPYFDVPLRYVKYGQLVIPAPGLRVPGDAETVAVYFEVRHLGLDPTGRTDFDVSYEIYESSRELRDLALVRADVPRGDLERIEPLTLRFLQERTGVSSEGLVVKGAEIDVSGLDEGSYVIVVTIHDRHAGERASRVLPFRKQGD